MSRFVEFRETAYNLEIFKGLKSIFREEVVIEREYPIKLVINGCGFDGRTWQVLRLVPSPQDIDLSLSIRFEMIVPRGIPSHRETKNLIMIGDFILEIQPEASVTPRRSSNHRKCLNPNANMVRNSEIVFRPPKTEQKYLPKNGKKKKLIEFSTCEPAWM